MDKKEKLLLLQLILIDIRGNWAWENQPRIPKALELAKELNLPKHVERISEYQEGSDGRHFRTHYKFGGYVGMEELHGLDFRLLPRSPEFRKTSLRYLTYPEYIFQDMSSVWMADMEQKRQFT